MVLCSLLLVSAGILVTLQAAEGSDNVLCYATVNRVTGHCEAFLGEGVSQESCCNNNNYAFRKDSQSPCEACNWLAEWSQWSEWSSCTVSCLEGVQNRRRVCIGQGQCEGNDLEVQVCKLQDCCPKDGGWSQWSEWSSCSVTCAVGWRKHSRLCNSPSPTCGGSCQGQAEESEQCDTNTICPTHGQWGNWQAWGQCSSSCIMEDSRIFPTQSRSRLCNSPAPSSNPPGNPCEGNDQESRDCSSVPICPVHGQWGPWQRVAECSVTCGVGQVTEKRSCDNPAPRHGGADCVESPTKYIICDTATPCPVDGQWSEWEQWSECKQVDNTKIRCSKRYGGQNRKRRCRIKEPKGEWCPGDYRERRDCYHVDQCSIRKPGTWTEWSQWGLCSHPCGHSERKRYRECLPNYSDYRPETEGPIVSEKIYFWGTPKFKCDELNGQTLKLEETMECKNTPPCL